MICDCHVHSRGSERGGAILRAMDDVGIDKICLFAPYGGESAEKQRESTDFVAKVASEDPERILGFAWIEPALPEAAKEVERAVVDLKLRGIKMIPNHWYPYDEKVFPVYEKMGELGVPGIFHSGILWGFQDSSRFCRPCFYEALLHFPKVKFALAHIGWPWTDECIATAGRFRAAVGWDNLERWQMYIDITPGTPPIYRKDALARAISYVGPDRLIYGSDSARPEDPNSYMRVLERDRRLFREELNLPSEDEGKIMGGNLVRLLEPMA
ncbi:MAG: amidohydrolase family protein [bacterium]